MLFHPPFLIVGGFESAFIALTSLDQVKSASSSILPIVHPRVILSNAWFQADGQIPVLQPQRPLPVRPKPDLSWETWLPVAALPQAFLPHALTLARARLSHGAVVRSNTNTNVPDYGSVPGSNLLS